MPRARRLLDLIQTLHQHRAPVSGTVLAEKLGVSLRTLYRDIAVLKTQGAAIDGEAGVGYVLKDGFLLPPLMFTEEEAEALALAAQWIAQRADVPTALAMHSALAKIAMVLPPTRKQTLEEPISLVGPDVRPDQGDEHLPLIRSAIRAGHKLDLDYADKAKDKTRRTVWPLALGFFEHVRVFVAWCELRQDFRHFRTDRIRTISANPERLPRRRTALLREWRALECASSNDSFVQTEHP